MLRRTGQSNISLGSDAVLALGVAGAVALLVFPLPTLLIDGLLAVQLGFSVVILLVALAVRHPLELSAFPRFCS